MESYKFFWVLFYIIGAALHASDSPDTFVESLFVVFPAFIVGLVPALLVFFIFKRKQWSWYHILHIASIIMIIWIVMN